MIIIIPRWSRTERLDPGVEEDPGAVATVIREVRKAVGMILRVRKTRPRSWTIARRDSSHTTNSNYCSSNSNNNSNNSPTVCCPTNGNENYWTRNENALKCEENTKHSNRWNPPRGVIHAWASFFGRGNHWRWIKPLSLVRSHGTYTSIQSVLSSRDVLLTHTHIPQHYHS